MSHGSQHRQDLSGWPWCWEMFGKQKTYSPNGDFPWKFKLTSKYLKQIQTRQSTEASFLWFPSHSHIQRRQMLKGSSLSWIFTVGVKLLPRNTSTLKIFCHIQGFLQWLSESILTTTIWREAQLRDCGSICATDSIGSSWSQMNGQ